MSKAARGGSRRWYIRMRARVRERTNEDARTHSGSTHPRDAHPTDTADGTQPTQALANKLSQPQARLEYYRED